MLLADTCTNIREAKSALLFSFIPKSKEFVFFTSFVARKKENQLELHKGYEKPSLALN